MMPPAAEKRLRRAGYRITRQRAAVYDFLRSTDSHPTAEAIHNWVKQDVPHISLATVYNAVDSLVDVGLARRIQRGVSAARYDADVQGHAHFRCIGCDGIWDVPTNDMPAISLDAFEVVDVNVEVVGYCPKCRRDKLGLSPIPERPNTRHESHESAPTGAQYRHETKTKGD